MEKIFFPTQGKYLSKGACKYGMAQHSVALNLESGMLEVRGGSNVAGLGWLGISMI